MGELCALYVRLKRTLEHNAARQSGEHDVVALISLSVLRVPWENDTYIIIFEM